MVFTAGLLVGLAIGAGVALLVAPQTGADARRALVRRGRRLRRRGVDAWEDLRDELRRVRRRRDAENGGQREEALTSDF
jgi:gas vesicle protein